MDPPYLATCKYCTSYSTELNAAFHGITMEIRDADTLERTVDLFSTAIITAYEHNCLPSEIKKVRETH